MATQRQQATWGRAVVCGLAAGCASLFLTAQPASALSEMQRGAIRQNCSTIQQNLGQLQKIDSRTRTYLGTTYETLANRFITPLNLRLVKNNRPTLSGLQAEFSTEQANFRSAYTDYMRELESLITTDCRQDPDGFYDKLEITRARRADLRSITMKLSRLAEEQYTAVVELRRAL